MHNKHSKSPTTDDLSKRGHDGDIIKIIGEIAILLEIPEIADYFSQALIKAKNQFHDKIKGHYISNGNIRIESSKIKPSEKEREISELSKAFGKNKTYFFEMIRLEDPKTESYNWELGKFKLNANKKTIHMIFKDFIRKVDELEIVPYRILEEYVYFPPLDKWLQINYTKSSPSRVVGFVKEAEKIEEKLKKEEIEKLLNDLKFKDDTSQLIQKKQDLSKVKGDK